MSCICTYACMYMYMASSFVSYVPLGTLLCVAQLKGSCDIECSLCGGVWDVRRIRGWCFNEGRSLGSLWRWLRWYIRVEHRQIYVLSGIILLHSTATKMIIIITLQLMQEYVKFYKIYTPFTCKHRTPHSLYK